MDYLSAIIFGIIQGITEFLPISSSGHLVVLHKFLDIPIKNELNFDVMLHLASLLAVVIYFYNDILKLIKGFFDFKNFTNKSVESLKSSDNQWSRLSWFIIIATIPAAILGFFLDDLIENILRSLWVVVVMLISIGFLFIFVEKLNKENKDLTSLTWKKSLFIGLAQAIALIPGTSRSGITIIAGIFSGLKKTDAIKFSFLMSVPIIAGANLIKLPQIMQSALALNEITILIIAFIATFISSILTIKYFLQFAQICSFKFFAYYRFVLAFILIGFIFLNQ